MSSTPLDLNIENDDSVIPIDSPHEKRPFARNVARNHLASRSIRSEPIEEGNSARRLSVTPPIATSLDSDDSSHIPGPSSSDAPRRRRLNTVIRGALQRSSNNQHGKSEYDIQTVSSSSDVENPNSSHASKTQRRRPRTACTHVTYLESGHEVRHQEQQDHRVDWGGRSAPERKRRADHTPRLTAPKRRSSRRASSNLKDEGIMQVKKDRQKREANQAKKPNRDRSPYELRARPPPAPETISIEDDEGDVMKYDASIEEPNQVNNIHSKSDCHDDMKYVPQPEKDYNMTRKGSATAATRPPRDVSEPEEVLSLDREQIAEEVKDLNIDAPYCGPTHLIFEYPRGQKGKIRVTAEERGRLAEKKYLNDSLIDFFFKYQEIALQQRAPDLRLTAKFFSSFFFGRLRRTKPIDYEGVRGWTKDVDIFSKQFVFVPICDSYHWSLIIVANLHNLNEFLHKREADYVEHERPRIVYLDSLDPSRGTAFGDSIRRYLVEEWLCRKEHRAPEDGQKKALLQRFKTAIPLLKAKVPLQTNEYDCGLYVLNSLEMFLNNDVHFMDDLLSGEDQVSEAYTHVDIQMLREKLVFLMDQFELEWREKTCLSSDEAQSKPRENRNAPSPCEFHPQHSNHLAQQSFDQTNLETQKPAELHSFIPEGTSDSLVLHNEAEIHEGDGVLSESLMLVNEDTTAHEVYGDRSIGNPEVGKAARPADSASENPEMETEMENNSMDREKGLRSSPPPRRIEVGSASVSDIPQWSQNESDQCERSSRRNCDSVDQPVTSLGGQEEQTEIVESKTNKQLETPNHEFDNESNQEMQERGLLISYDTMEGFCFKQSSQPVHDNRDESKNGFQESQCIEEEPLEALDPNIKPPRISEGMAAGYGGNNTHYLTDGYRKSEGPREIYDDAEEHTADGIDIHGKNKKRNHQQDGSRLCSPPPQNEPSEETMQTIDHMGQTKTYMRTSSASDP